ncbi:MAG TPA: hypothetical protein VK928_13395 [Longimicrobiales bacterium]|nr:hypothetical protein [Longimicrobiales bacterium]
MSTPSRTPAIIGFLIAGAVILGLGFFGDRFARNDDATLPALAIAAPADGDSLANPVTLSFTSAAPLELHTGMGWMAGELHLHAMVDGAEIMPAAADIRPVGTGYEWRLPNLDAGERTLYLTWAGRHHGNLAGTSDTIRIHILP